MVVCVVYSIRYNTILNCYKELKKFKFENFDRYDQKIQDSNSYINMFHCKTYLKYFIDNKYCLILKIKFISIHIF